MTTKSARKIFVNLPVKDLKKSMEFFRQLDFDFNPQFTDDSAACMVISDEGFVMLLGEPRFRDFAKKPIADARATTGGIFAFSVDSRADVDRIAEVALGAGATPAGEKMDMGFMYLRSFYDLDGHHWEVFWMDPAAMKK